MFFIPSLFIFCTAALALAAPTDLAVIKREAPETQLVRRTTVSPGEGTVNGMFFSLFEQVESGVVMNIGTKEYSLTWTPAAVDLVAGIGWNPGSAQTITYSGTFSPNGNAYLSVYGWFTNPLVEYYIMESFGDFNPGTGLAQLGTVTSDGGTYSVFKNVRQNAPSIEGTQTFNQILSIRQSHRVGGTVTTANHFNAWKSLGLQLGTFNYQIVATEGFESSGSSSITVEAP